MRIFYAFLIIVTSTILWMLPVTTAVYDFRTDVRKDTFVVSTPVGVTAANVTLLKALYTDDTSTISFTSNVSETPSVYSWVNGTKQLWVASLSANETRNLVVSYDVDALNGVASLNTLLDKVPLVWMLIIVAFPVAALAAIFLGRG